MLNLKLIKLVDRTGHKHASLHEWNQFIIELWIEIWLGTSAFGLDVLTGIAAGLKVGFGFGFGLWCFA